MRVVQDEILDMDKLTFKPEHGRRVMEMRALDNTVAHRRAGGTLVETGDRQGCVRWTGNWCSA